MKYLIRIFLIVFIISALSYLVFTPKTQNNRQEDIALSVNGHQFLKERINAEQSKYGYHADELSSVYNSIITEEVLIQEAQRQGIDKEEDFRLALKTYYEQSLVKILLERQTKQITINITDKDIDNYYSKIGSKITFTRIENSGTGEEKSTTSSALFDDLAESLKLVLSALRPGEQVEAFDTGNEKFTLHLDNITPAESPPYQDISRDEVKLMLHDAMVQQRMNRWLAQLIDKADITFHNPGKKQ